MYPWVTSGIRAIISGVAGVGAACITHQATHHTRVAPIIGAIVTGISIALLQLSDSRRIGSVPPETPPAPDALRPSPPSPSAAPTNDSDAESSAVTPAFSGDQSGATPVTHELSREELWEQGL